MENVFMLDVIDKIHKTIGVFNVKIDKTIGVFKVSLFISVRNMFLSKAFSITEMNIYQSLRLNYYKKIKEWCTDDVEGDCISFCFV